MRVSLQEPMRSYKFKRRVKKAFRRIACVLGCIVAFITTYALILPAITLEQTAFCGIDEHTHDASCYSQQIENRNLICTLPEHTQHVHDTGCYYTPEPVSHSHSDNCVVNVMGDLICTQLVCEGHKHGDSCYQITTELLCANSQEHIHTDECYSDQQLICTLEENHVHDSACYRQELVCQIPESDGHSHGDDCYHWDQEYGCGLEEGPLETAEPQLLCTEPVAAGHIHDSACFEVAFVDAEPVCGQTHEHTYICYPLACQLTEHTHELQCYSDPSADVENRQTWEATMQNVELTGDWYADTLAIAESQLGYTESTRNYEVGKDNTIHGYTRYGDWYGSPYGDWCAMFASFCLRYAGVDTIAIHANVPRWIENLTEQGLYRTAAEAQPKPGCLVFFDWTENALADHVGIVVEMDGQTLKTIEGNSGDKVCYRTHNLADSHIMGYSMLPQKLSDEALAQIEAVISLIDAMPSADEIDAKIEEFEIAEDYEGEEVWLTEVYQQVGQTYLAYMNLDEALHGFVTNREKLLELEYIWSALPLANGSVWLDGTNGTLMAFTNSDNTRISLQVGQEYTLPETWKSPAKYNYALNGWYDITTGTYYKPGDTLTVEGDHVLYADWMASTYDVGIFNEHTVDSLDTNSFITTHVFDYSSIFNMYSTTYTGTISSSSHSETWDAVRRNLTAEGTPVNKNDTLGFIFRDWDNGGKDLSYPKEANEDWNKSSTGSTSVTAGIMNTATGQKVLDMLFYPADTDSNNDAVLGKKYVGTGNYLYQYMEEGLPNYDGVHNGYFYYDSTKNAASYNQTDARFYVYDYLERTSDSLKDGCNSNGTMKTAGGHSDFLPFNSPYANTNGMNQVTYQVGESNQINYEYDAKYDGEQSEKENIGTNYWYGFSSTIEFYLPNDTGYSETINGQTVYGNQSTHGQDMTFHFSGDDDVWVYIDGELVLDLGGMHDIVDGDINFSTGHVISAGTTSDLHLEEGSHKLTIYYMERGASQANCMIYFNIAPRFTLNIEKEDYLDRHLLNGAQFTVYTDEACTEPAKLWPSHEAYLADKNQDNFVSTFVVADGRADLWGFSTGHTYYIKETSPPDGYPIPKGIIRLTMDNVGNSNYEVLDVVEENGEPITPGFTAYGFRIDPETEQAYLIITNGDGLLAETTSVLAKKVWDDTATTHPDVPVYLLADGARIREVTLNESNNWQYIWENLPRYKSDGNGGTITIDYTVQEGTVPGYVGKVTELTELEESVTTWTQSTTGFTGGNTYLLNAGGDYLATVSGTDASLQWVDEATAKASPTAHWTASGNNNSVILTNGVGQTLYYYSGSYNSRYYYAAASGSGYRNLTFNTTNGRLYYNATTDRYLSKSFNGTGRLAASTNSNVASFTLYKETTTTVSTPIEGIGYLITNTPASETTSLTVNKEWLNGDTEADTALYQTLSVPVKLLANGADTGQTLTLKYSNNWTATFTNLPVEDAGGKKIEYSVVEVLGSDNWQATYSYSGTIATISNHYQLIIPVEKVWGADVTDLPQSITLNLYSAAGDGQTATLLDTLTLTAANKWSGSFKAVYPDADQIYYVYEPSGEYSVSYSSPAEIFINGVRKTVAKVTFTDSAQSQPATVTVTNQMLYELPETGGAGTCLYTGAGLLLILNSMAFLLYKYKKRRKEVL